MLGVDREFAPVLRPGFLFRFEGFSSRGMDNGEIGEKLGVRVNLVLVREMFLQSVVILMRVFEGGNEM